MRAAWLGAIILAGCATAAPPPTRTLKTAVAPGTLSVAIKPITTPMVRLHPLPKIAARNPSHRCDAPSRPAMPDPATAPGLAEAVVRLTERDKLWSDYAHRLEAALKACR